MLDLIILGAGPAGLSAAVYALRANITPKIIGLNRSALEDAMEIENYFGFSNVIRGSELLKFGKEQVLRLGGEITAEEIVGVSWNGHFTVVTDKYEYESEAVIFTLGSARKNVEIDGIKRFKNNGVSFCAVCDSFFYKNKTVGVLGSGEYALHEAKTLLNVTKKIFIMTNGENPMTDFSGMEIIKEPIAALLGEEKLSGALLKNGKRIDFDGLFIGLGTASSDNLASSLGIITEKGKIMVDSNMKTNLAGCFAAGDCVPGVMQVSVAVAEGCKAALSAVEFLKIKGSEN
ncbi:MAG: NAD(P)/FAD-dependent oxidoreductase [Eubacterium sp.]|jgi:thioredoxin reductase (NADPH)|nr:NAD(P)/FAD-dependent oxidoreductase [Eubacterium sp.]